MPARADLWQKAWQRDPLKADVAEVLFPLTLPGQPAGRHGAAYLAWGLGAGGLIGLIAASVARRPKRLRIVGWALARRIETEPGRAGWT